MPPTPKTSSQLRDLCSPTRGVTAPTAPKCPRGVAAPQHSLQNTLNAGFASPWITVAPGQASLTRPSFPSLRFSSCPVRVELWCPHSRASGRERISAAETSHPPAPSCSCTRPSALSRREGCPRMQTQPQEHCQIPGQRAPSPEPFSCL